MRSERRSTAQVAPPVPVGGQEWRCRKHRSPAAASGGVCPYCLRDRLLRLCPDCGHVRPCPCTPAVAVAAASPSSSSSSSSFSLAGGSVGRVSSLIERDHRAAIEPRIARSRSIASVSGGRGAAGERRRGWGRIWGWPFSKAAKEMAAEDEEEVEIRMGRSSSVTAAVRLVESGGGGGGGGEGKSSRGWSWYFPSPIKAFRHRKSAAERSPLQR